MKYFTNNQYGNVIIVELDRLPNTIVPNCTALSEEQLAFMDEHPEATPMEVMQCKSNTAPVIEEPELTLDEYKENAKTGISDLSLETSRKKVSDYQFLNAQSSLMVADGSGIYTHTQASEYIQLYNTVGKQCRAYYYSFVEKLDKCTTIESAEALVDETTKWYESL